MQKIAMSMIAVFLLAAMAAGSGRPARSWFEPWTAVETTCGTRTGGKQGRSTWSRSGELRRRGREDGRPGRAAVRQQPRLQRRRAEPVLGERHLAVGLGVGAVRRPRHRPARRDARGERADGLRRQGSAREFRTTSAASRSRAHPQHPAPVRSRSGSRSTRSTASSMRRRSTASTSRGWTGFAPARPVTATRRTTRRRC